jgi:triacylglycerol lipase
MANFPPQPDRAYSRENALALALAAQLAYQGEERILDQSRMWGLSQCRFLDRRGTQCFVAADDCSIVVAFRGTESVAEDWRTNLDFPKVRGPRGLIHCGFREALDHVWDELLDVLRTLRTAGQDLWLTGHSLGAALATVAAARLEFDKRIEIRGLYTFGSPRVGDSQFKRFAEARFGRRNFRFANYHDLVTRVPFEWMGYEHVGQVRFFDAGGVLHEDPFGWYDFVATEPVGDLFVEILGTGCNEQRKAAAYLRELLEKYAACHAIERYVELLAKAAGHKSPALNRAVGACPA